MDIIQGEVIREIYEFIGKEADKSRDRSRQETFYQIRKMMKSHLKVGQPVTEEMVDSLLRSFRHQIKKVSKAHNVDASKWNVYETYRETFFRFFKDDNIPKTVTAFRDTLWQYII